VQETRGWVEEKGVTVSQRSKEYAHDYRYFPEPDLPPMVFSSGQVEEIRSKLPELPEARRNRFINEYGLPLYDASLLTSSKEMADYEEEFIRSGQSANIPVPNLAKLGSNWLLGEVSRIINADNRDIGYFQERVKPEHLVGLAVYNNEGVVNTATAKSMLEEMYRTQKDPKTLLEEGERGQISDTRELEDSVSQVVAGNPQAVADFKKGKETALKFLVGQVMKATKGRANPQVVNELLEKKLKEE